MRKYRLSLSVELTVNARGTVTLCSRITCRGTPTCYSASLTTTTFTWTISGTARDVCLALPKTEIDLLDCRRRVPLKSVRRRQNLLTGHIACSYFRITSHGLMSGSECKPDRAQP